MSDTLTKVLEESNEKLKKAEALEASAVGREKNAATLRDESDANLKKIQSERQGINSLNAAKDAEFARREQELKNREVTLAAGQLDLERKTTESNKTFETSHAALDARGVSADKADRRNREFAETLDKRAEKYNSIAEFISTTL